MTIKNVCGMLSGSYSQSVLRATYSTKHHFLSQTPLVEMKSQLYIQHELTSDVLLLNKPMSTTTSVGVFVDIEY